MTSNSTARETTATPYGTLPPASPVAARKPISLPRLQEMRQRGEKITMLTAYDATFAAVADAAGVECILVGDSLGMVCQGLPSTVGVTLETMRYHTESVARGIRRVQGSAWIIGDLPFGRHPSWPKYYLFQLQIQLMDRQQIVFFSLTLSLRIRALQLKRGC